MKRKMIVAILTAAIATYLGISSGMIAPLTDAVYCSVAKDCL